MTIRLDLRADCIDGVESARSGLDILIEVLTESGREVVGSGAAKTHVESAWRSLSYALEALTS